VVNHYELGAQMSKTANMLFLSITDQTAASDSALSKNVQKKDKKMLTLAASFEILRPHTENITLAI